ncbi:hypothetical protein [Ectothiorhodospira variabilis]|uniref:hypothetical protein n=1 Tax=Ectothiorhodospira variabilis TaxID=505694 RepID=UPI001EFBA754|nr:hypothetical protein [Ectothiorhodospira variabilis]MCG5494949.1 hypothetical protein [Ectothiorhodospira variabilis]MCG5504462.1 hypothetical protein [Ectothiorhodospira variabilis]MCG5507672.1 hypothetical protein [Ectothiorhodospira variabilis]
MNRKSIKLIAVLMSVGLLTAGGAAQADSFALGAKVGTTGLGVEGTYGLRENVNLRGGLYGFTYSTDVEETDVDYDADLKLRSAALLADWHPFSGGFRLTAGAYYNGNELTGKARGELDIGDGAERYQGTLDATIDWRSFAPYLGIGYGNAIQGGRWSFALDAGVMFTGSPDVSLRGQVETNDDDVRQRFREDVREEERELQDDLDDFKYYPVLSLGVAYRF